MNRSNLSRREFLKAAAAGLLSGGLGLTAFPMWRNAARDKATAQPKSAMAVPSETFTQKTIEPNPMKKEGVLTMPKALLIGGGVIAFCGAFDWKKLIESIPINSSREDFIRIVFENADCEIRRLSRLALLKWIPPWKVTDDMVTDIHGEVCARCLRRGVWFKLTTKVFEKLQRSKVPDEVVNSLQPLKNNKFTNEKAFVDALEHHLTPELLEHHHQTILSHAHQYGAFRDLSAYKPYGSLSFKSHVNHLINCVATDFIKIKKNSRSIFNFINNEGRLIMNLESSELPPDQIAEKEEEWERYEEDCKKIQVTINSLLKRDQTIIKLRMKNLSYREIAEVMDELPPKPCQSDIEKATNRLRQEVFQIKEKIRNLINKKSL